MSRFIIFSAVLFIVILVAGTIAFMFSMRQIIRTNKDGELSQLLEIKRLRLETSVENEISLALMIADSPLIRSFFKDPGNPDLRRMAFEEMAANRHAFSANNIFWVNDIDRLFHLNDDDPYLVDPERPDNYWYRMTLYENEAYNININYNPDLNVTNLWINAPVLDADGKPLGMIGTGIELTAFIEMIYKDYNKNTEVYFFNAAGEITGAKDVGSVAAKKSINEELAYLGADVLAGARSLAPGETLSLEFPEGRVAISGIPLLEWYSVAVFFYSLDDYDSAMTALFVLTLLVLALVLVIFNIFISKLLTPMRLSMEEAEAANKAKSAFLSTMSHEIRTPLNAILGIAEIQLQKESLEQSVRDGFEKMFVSGELLLGIINDILDLSKIESGKLELIPGPYEVASLIGDTVQLNIIRIGSKTIEFILRVDENIPARLVGDELRIKQILNNLLSNALKYTEKGTVRMTVSSGEIDGKDEETMLAVEVSDTGQGMTKEQVSRLFDTYARFNMEANRKTEGTGLGMSITQKLLRMMNGEISIDSEPGKGSVFTVLLPQGIAGPDILGKEVAESLCRFRTGGRSLKKRAQIKYDQMPEGSVLIVDDVETNLYVAKGLMGPYGITIDTADSGYGAIERIKGGKTYDIVFMDHMMPNMDGIETTKIMREMGYDKPIVALTANAVAGQADMFIRNGFNDFISKPIDRRHLDDVLKRLVRDKQPAGEAKETAAAGHSAAEEKPEFPDIARNWTHRRYVEAFLRDANRSIAVLEEFVQRGEPHSEEEVRICVVHTHGMKSALAYIGNKELSAVALKLEVLGRDNDVEGLIAETPPFLNALKAFTEGLAEA